MPPSHNEALAENAILRAKLHNTREQNRKLLAALSYVLCHHLGGHPGTDRLLADLHMQEPSAPTEGSHSNERPST